MRVRDLGSLMVAVDAREQLVGGRIAPALLAMLTVNVNERVSSDALMDAVWGERDQRRSESTLVSHIWRLRRLLEPDRDRWERSSVLVSEPGGFRLVGAPSSVDSLAFAEAASEVAGLLAAGHADSALRRAQAALTLWRGQPYGEFADALWAEPAVARLYELRGQIQERRIRALVALGDLDLALSDLPALIAAAPLRESLRALHMEVLHRQGRKDEALQAYHQARKTLVDELGIEPNADLMECHRRVLSNEPPIPPAVPRVALAPARAGEVHLPRFGTPLIGREDVQAHLTQLIATSPLLTVVGAAGCGKTRLAVEVARAAAGHFPDGVWFVDLTTVSDLELVVDLAISAIGFNPSAGSTPLEDLRNYVQNRRLLLVLDNCEHVLSATALLAQLCLDDAADSSKLLATSREPLDVDGEIVWSLPPLELPAPEDPTRLGDAPAVQLFVQRLTAAAPNVPIDDHMLSRIADICIAVDGLPLALELAAARAASHTIDDVARQVQADPGRLARVGRTIPDHRATVRSAIEWSHRLLNPQQQAVHRRLSVLPGPFTAHLAAAVVADTYHQPKTPQGVDAVDGLDVDDILAQLVHRSLLSSDGQSEHTRPTAFRQLATVRSHAQHALAGAPEADTCRDRRDEWTIELIAARPPLGTAAEADWYQEIDDNYAAVRATLARHLIDEPSTLGGRLAARLSYYWYYRQKLAEAYRWLELGHDTFAHEQSVDALISKITFAAALLMRYRTDLAAPYVKGSLAQLHDYDNTRLVDIGEALAGLATAAYTARATQMVVDVHRHLEQVARDSPAVHLRLLVDAIKANSLLMQDRTTDAVSTAQDAYSRARAADHPTAAWVAASPPMVIALITQQPAEGIKWVDRVISQHYRLGVGACGMFLENRANFMALAGDYTNAVRLYASARTQTRRAAMLWPRRPLTEQLIQTARHVLDAQRYEDAWQSGETLSMADIVHSISLD